MNTIKRFCGLLSLLLIMLIVACKTDPIIPDGGIVAPDLPIVQDPGDENLCDEGVISFQHQVLPIMISSCAYSGCHDAITAEDDIELYSYEKVLKEVTPGDPNNSELYESIIEPDPNDIMPPPPASPLSNEQISIIRNWISQGANNTDCGTTCDSTAASYANDIAPLLQDYCVGCHNSSRSDGNVNLESHAKVVTYVDNGTLMGSIIHDPLYAKMPPSGSKLSDCRIAQVQKWIDEGAQDN